MQPNLTFEYVERGKGGLILLLNTQDVITKALELSEQGLSTRKISHKLAEDGIAVGKTKIAEIVQKHNKVKDETGTSTIDS